MNSRADGGRHVDAPIAFLKSDLYPHFDANNRVTHVCWRLKHADGRCVEGRADTVNDAYRLIQSVVDVWYPPETRERSMFVGRVVLGNEGHREIKAAKA